MRNIDWLEIDSLESTAHSLCRDQEILHNTLGVHLLLCAKAIQAIARADTGDSDDAAADAAIREALGQAHSALVLAEARRQAEESLQRLTLALKECT
jgi:hypothetical protein